MIIRLLGFEWNLPGVVTPEQFHLHLRSLNRKQIPFGGYTRVCVAAITHGQYVGAFLTIKDQKRYATIDGSLKVTIREILEGTQMIDFNFFVLSKNSKNNAIRGLYSAYKGSTTLGKFNRFVTQQYDILKEKLIAEESKHGTRTFTEDEKANQKRQVERKYSSTIGTTQLFREEDWDAQMEQLKRLSSLRVDSTFLTNEQPWWKFSSSAINSQKLEISFSATADQPGLKAEVKQLIMSKGILRGKIKGKDEEDFDEAIDLLKTPTSYKAYDYDDIAKEEQEGIFLNYEHVQKSPFLVTMVEELEKYPELGDF